MKRVRIATLVIAALMASSSFAADGPKWSGWSDDLFARATAEKRFVILDLEAVWCHWCHMMEKTTYADPAVQELLASNYLPVRVDQDANPDLSSRALPARYKRLDWLDLREGKLPNADVEYPDLGEPAAFACSNRICSFPAFTAEELQANVKQMAKLKPARAALN
jgi:uncharacterized protein YyaL (SSP411 family)